MTMFENLPQALNNGARYISVPKSHLTITLDISTGAQPIGLKHGTRVVTEIDHEAVCIYIYIHALYPDIFTSFTYLIFGFSNMGTNFPCQCTKMACRCYSDEV